MTKLAIAVRLPLCLGFLFAVTHGAWALDWRVLVDNRFSTRIEYPADLFTEVTKIPEGLVASSVNARFEMSAMDVQGVRTSADLRSLIEGAEGYEKMTYTPGGSRWLVVSGYRKADIYYEKFLIGPDMVRGFSLQYPSADRKIFDPIVERMEDTFKVEVP